MSLVKKEETQYISMSNNNKASRQKYILYAWNMNIIFFYLMFILHMSVTENNQKDREPIKIFPYYNGGVLWSEK